MFSERTATPSTAREAGISSSTSPTTSRTACARCPRKGADGRRPCLRRGRDDAAPARRDDPLANFCVDLVARARGRKDRPADRPRGRESSARFRSSRAARTTRCSSVTPASARPPSSKASRRASTTSPGSAEGAARSTRSTWARSSRARATAATSKNDSRACSRRSRATRKPILFIDEIHTIIGAGATQGGSMDASNLLKPALASGELRVDRLDHPQRVPRRLRARPRAGATLPDHRRDRALGRRVHPHPPRAAQALRDAPRHHLHGRRDSTRPRASPRATSTIATSRTRRSTCSTRRGPQRACTARARSSAAERRRGP